MKETLFISHGSPTLAINDFLPARSFLKSLCKDSFFEKPKSILLISGHWETDHPTVNAVDGPLDTIHDFFPKYMNHPILMNIKYLAPGAPALANRVKEMLTASGFEQVSIDKERGLDHGAWVPLILMYPEANIPVCQLSVCTNKDAAYHYNLGKALAPLKEQGVLIIGSGSATHSIESLCPSEDGSVASWALEFDTWIRDALLAGRFKDVIEYEEKAPYAKLAHPRPDHLYPLHVAMGAADENAKAEVIHQSWDLHTLSYSSYKFT